MKKLLIASYDMEVGGVERSLISMLDSFNYDKHTIDLMLYRHKGDFMPLLPKQPNLLTEIPLYSTFRKSIGEIVKDKFYFIAFSRILSKLHANFYKGLKKMEEPGYYQMQLMWKYALPFLPKMDEEYDVAISYLWPHYFIAEKVKARKKIAWIHTDYSKVETNIKMDLYMWEKFDHIIAVSEACKESFLSKYKELEKKILVIENITSPDVIRTLGKEQINNPMEADNRFKILTVARLSHAKGIDQAIKALKLLKDKGYEDIVWYVVGYGGDEAKIRELITEYNLQDSFILLGKQINPYPYITKCDIYVQPSRYEGKAVTVTEAKILGKPILITNYSTSNSQILNGKEGIICDLSVSGIATGIQTFFHNDQLRDSISNNNLRIDYGNNNELEKLYSLI
ncbi:glycosyltransferase [Neobacillus sp. MER 74]|uniref:glycosyltransferase n=1 Tax=Neobacillus sp. MER 74 TaxID=2939566 RepID=UPI00203E80EE|nr:glycosyltransferase [Neobacillus sp. MER 74]MCM3115089.1 glycosyltransferase [Neobacillus sp. MER 74]